MGVFSEIAMEQQNSMFDSSAAFEDDEAFELEEMESLPVPPVGTDTVPVSAASVSAGETALADAEEEPADEVAPAGEEKSAEEGNSAQPPAAEDEEKKRAEHEAAEAQRKAEFDAKQQAKKAAEQEQIARLEAMSDEEVIAASTQRVSTDVEKLTRRNMKECVSEHIQMLCMEDTAFARLTMHPKKNMIRCFQYINRKACHPSGETAMRYCVPGRIIFPWQRNCTWMYMMRSYIAPENCGGATMIWCSNARRRILNCRPRRWRRNSPMLMLSVRKSKRNMSTPMRITW